MAFNPQPSNEDVLFQSDQSPQYNNGVAQDETMCYESEEEHSSGDELQVGDQDVDYTQLERIIAGTGRRNGGRVSAQRSGASQPQSFGTQHGRRRSVHGVRLFTTPPGQQSRGTAAQSTAVPDCLSVEDITGVGSQAPASAFSLVVQASLIHNAPPAAESQPSTRRHHIPRRT